MSEASPVTPVMAYADRITYRQGEVVELRASGEGPVEVDLVRLLHPPDDPDWSTPCWTPTDAAAAQRVDLVPQETFAGSYLTAPVALPAGQAFAGSCYVLPTRLGSDQVQGLWSWQPTDGSEGVTLTLEPGAGLVLRLGGAAGVELRSSLPLVQGRWQVVSFSVDPVAGTLALAHRLVAPAPGGLGTWSGSLAATPRPPVELAVVLVGAARLGAGPVASSVPGSPTPSTSFNGKVDAPVLVAGAVEESVLAAATPESLAAGGRVVVAWDLSQHQSTSRVVDTGGHGYDALLVNSPARAMTGVHWRGEEQSWTHAPGLHSAVHLHDDDLDDARWSVAARVPLPDDLPTGVYGVRVRRPDAAADEDPELVTVVVVPRQPDPAVQTLVVLPTYTYVAYANLLGNGDDTDYVKAGLAEGDVAPHAGMTRLSGFPAIGGSLYDVHSDGSGRCYSSPRRPVLNLRLDWKSSRRDAYRHLAADLYLLQWLESLGVAYHVTTDHVLDASGAQALAGYSTVLTGSHPEYVSRAELDALQTHLDGGGSLLYLGGNGFYWVTTESRDVPEMLEVRRGFAGTRTWTGAAGENHHSTTGELGGLWRHRGLPPNALVGVGFAAQGADGGAAGYRRAADALAGPASFLFTGVDAEVFGTTGFDMGGAAGDEVDRFDLAAGSPPWGTVVASSLELSKFYKLAIEDLQISRENVGGDHEKDVRSDLVVVEQAAGGFVFAVGSISWVQAMAVGEFDNDVARITENALRAALGRAGAGAAAGLAAPATAGGARA